MTNPSVDFSTERAGGPNGRSFAVWSASCAAATAAIAAIALHDHFTGAAEAGRFGMPLESMRPSAAISLLLLAGACALLIPERVTRWSRRLAAMACVVVLVLATLSALELAFGVPVSFETLICTRFHTEVHGARTMAPIAAALLITLGIGFLLFEWRPASRWPSGILLTIGGTACLLPAFGYIYGIPSFFDSPAEIVPLPGATAALIMLAAAGLLARPSRGWLTLLRSPLTGGVVARRLLPAVILVPLFLGWARLAIRKANLLSAESATAALIYAIVLLTALFLVATAHLLDRRDIERREAESKFATFIDHAPDAVFVIDSSGAIQLTNSSAEEMFGYSREEIVGATPPQLLAPVSLISQALQCLSASVDSPGALGRESLGIRKDGSTFTSDVAFSTVDTSAGSIVIATIRDISRRKEMENALRATEARLREAQRIGQIGSWGWDIGSGSLTWSDQTYRIFDRPLGSQITFEAFLDLVCEEDRELVAETVRETLVNGRPYGIEHRIRTAREERIVFERGEVVCDDAGEPIGMIGTIQDVTEQRRAAEALERSEAMLQQTEEISRTGGWEYDVATGHLHWTRGVRRVHEVDDDYDPNDVASAMAFYEEADRAMLAALFRRAVEEGEPYDAELRLKTAAGRSRWVRTIARVDLGEDGRARRVYGYLMDVTDRREAEEARLAASVYARSLIEASPDPLVTISAEGKITDVNAATEAATGLGRDELIGTDFSDYFTDPEAAREGYRKVLSTGAVRDYALTIRSATGRLTEVLYNASLYHQPDGTVGGVFAAARDVTERNRAQDAALRLAAIVESTTEAIIGKTLDGYIVSWNRGAQGLYGYTAEEVIGRHITMLAPPERAAEVPGLIAQILRGEWVAPFETERVTKDGRSVTVLLTLSPIHNSFGQLVGISTIARDITDRKNAEDQIRRAMAELERSNRDLEQFAYVASHDLQEPLRMVSSYTQLLAQRYSERLDEDAQEFIEFAVDGARRMQRLVNDLLTYSRVGTRGAPLQLTDSHRALGLSLRNLQAAIEESGALVTNDDLPQVFADDGQLVQVFQNLIANGIKFRDRERPPRIHVAAARDGDEWIFSVRDNGIGIDPQFRSRLFVIFQRLHGRDEFPGTGIGLALCKRIIERHGGRIWMESEPGNGSTFYFTLSAVQHTEVTADVRRSR